jgi:hypothetical protein
MRWGVGILVMAVTSVVAACDVEWGGGRLTLEDPAPPPDTMAVQDADEPAPAPLPVGPLLYLASIEPTGDARLVPIAMLGDTIRSLELPAALDADFRARFDSAFLAPGTELELHAGGARIGSILVGDNRSIPDPACPSVGAATALILPGQTLPVLAFAVPRRVQGVTPRRLRTATQTRGMSVAGPVLAERLINDSRAFLARRVALKAVWLPPDTAPAMASTYLVEDQLVPGPPAGDAISLFFMARWEPTRGFIPVWQEVRRYSDARNKEAFEHLDWLTTEFGRVDVLRRYDGVGVGLAASTERIPGDPLARGIEWIEGPTCRGPTLLAETGGETESAGP